MLGFGRAKEYELVIVGKGQQVLDSTMMTDLKKNHSEHAEARSYWIWRSVNLRCGVTSSVLIIEDQYLIYSSESVKLLYENSKGQGY